MGSSFYKLIYFLPPSLFSLPNHVVLGGKRVPPGDAKTAKAIEQARAIAANLAKQTTTTATAATTGATATSSTSSGSAGGGAVLTPEEEEKRRVKLRLKEIVDAIPTNQAGWYH